jgi:hypothetical protein
MSTYTNRPVARRLPAIDIRKKTDQDKFPTNSSTQPGAETPGPTKEKQKRKKSRSTKRKSSTAPSEPSTATTKTESPHQRETSIVAKVSPQRTKFNVAGTSPQSKISPVSKESTVAETSSQQKSSTLTRPNKQGFVTKIVMSEEKITQVAASANSTSITHTKNLAKDLNTSLFSSIRLPSTMKGEEKSKPNKENEVPPINAKGLYKNLLHTRRAEVLCHELGLTLADVRRLRQKFNENDMYSTYAFIFNFNLCMCLMVLYIVVKSHRLNFFFSSMKKDVL